MPRFASSQAERLYAMFSAGSVLVTPSPPAKGDTLNQLVVSISEGCNLGCHYCFADEGRYGKKYNKFMSPALAREMLDKLYLEFSSIRYVKFFGGEPFLNLDCVEEIADRIVNHHEDNTRFN